LTIFTVKLESVKKIGDADVVMGVKKANGEEGPLTVIRTQDPNITHPLRQTDIVKKISLFHGKTFTAYTFQAVSWKYNLKNNPQYCWRAKEGVLTRYSNDVITFLKRLSKVEFDTSLSEYRAYLSDRRKSR